MRRTRSPLVLGGHRAGKSKPKPQLDTLSDPLRDPISSETSDSSIDLEDPEKKQKREETELFKRALDGGPMEKVADVCSALRRASSLEEFEQVRRSQLVPAARELCTFFQGSAFASDGREFLKRTLALQVRTEAFRADDSLIQAREEFDDVSERKSAHSAKEMKLFRQDTFLSNLKLKFAYRKMDKLMDEHHDKKKRHNNLRQVYDDQMREAVGPFRSLESIWNSFCYRAGDLGMKRAYRFDTPGDAANRYHKLIGDARVKDPRIG